MQEVQSYDIKRFARRRNLTIDDAKKIQKRLYQQNLQKQYEEAQQEYQQFAKQFDHGTRKIGSQPIDLYLQEKNLQRTTTFSKQVELRHKRNIFISKIQARLQEIEDIGDQDLSHLFRNKKKRAQSHYQRQKVVNATEQQENSGQSSTKHLSDSQESFIHRIKEKIWLERHILLKQKQTILKRDIIVPKSCDLFLLEHLKETQQQANSVTPTRKSYTPNRSDQRTKRQLSPFFRVAQAAQPAELLNQINKTIQIGKREEQRIRVRHATPQDRSLQRFKLPLTNFGHKRNNSNKWIEKNTLRPHLQKNRSTNIQPWMFENIALHDVQQLHTID